MYFKELIGEAGGYEQIAPGDTATGPSLSKIHPTSGKYSGLHAIAMFLTVEDQTVTVAFNGDTPTNAAGTNLGHKLVANDSLIIRGPESVAKFKVVDTVSASTGTVKITYFF